MEDKELFDENFIVGTVPLDNLDAHWRLIKRLREKNSQFDPYLFQEYRGVPSGACEFLCENEDNTSKQSITRIIMQYV
jgi:hypothetical protein